MSSDKNSGIHLKEETRNASNEIESQEEQCNESVSGPPSLAYSGDNEEEYLRATFARLGVGNDGYLSLEELTKVCHAIGMDKVAAEVIDQLFSRLDVDGDGRISFEEFLLMFQNGGPDTVNCSTIDDSLSQDSSLISNPGCLPSVTNPEMFVVTEFGLFSTLDPEGTGYVSVSRLVEAWFSVGLSDGARLLRELGLPYRSGQRVRLRDLAGALEEELRPPNESPQLFRQAALLTLLHEIKGLRASLETARGERDKCRWDLGEANHRLTLLAQELDDHNATMESNAQRRLDELQRQYKDQIRHLQELLSRERENGRESALTDSKELIAINLQLQEEESRLKIQIATLQEEMKKLEVENLELSVKLSEVQKHSQSMEKQIQEFKLKNKVAEAEYESMSHREEEFRRLAAKVDELQTENQALRDSNDELIAQVDTYSSRFVLSKHDDYSLEGSCIGDYLDTSSTEGTLGGVKRRGGSSPFRKSSPEDCNSEEDESSPRGSKIRKRNSTQFNFQYLDVTSHDESFLDGSFHPVDEKKHMTSSESSPRCFVPPIGLPASSQPSSLPLFLQSSSYSHSSRSKVETFENVLTAENFFILEEKLLQKMTKELENEIKMLKREKEEMTQEIVRTKQLLKKNEAESSFMLDLDCQTTEKNVSPSLSKSKSRFGQKCQQCVELESRLNVALDELDMSLKREKFLGKSERSDMAANLSKQKMVTSLEKELFQARTELMQARVELTQVVQERKHLREKEERNDGPSSVDVLTKVVRELCQELCTKLRRETSQSFGTPRNDMPQGTSVNGRDIITTIPEEDEPEEDSDEENDQMDGERNDEEIKMQGLEGILRRELEGVEKAVTRLTESVARERERLEKEKALAEDRLSRAEQDFQVLRSEYEKSEDYWNLKFQEEQDYYDEERKLYDEKFSALEAKIKEYEALASSGAPIEVPGPPSNGEVLSDDSEDRLSTIEESEVWERQVTDLEEEVRCLQKKLMQSNEEKENLEIAWREKLITEQRNAQQESNRLKNELDQARGIWRTLESQLNSVREELDNAKKNSGNETEFFSFQDNGNMNGYEPLVENQPQVCGSPPQGEMKNEFPEKPSSSGETSGQGTLKMQLFRCHKRIRQLEYSLKMRQKCSNEIINQTTERHKTEIQNLQSMITSTQQMFAVNMAKNKDQLTKVTKGDLLVRELYLENSQLMLALQVAEERQKAVEEQLRKHLMSTLAQTPKK